MRLLVTGGAGFVGSNLVRMALARGWQPIVLDDLSTGQFHYLEGLEGVRFHKGDILNRQLVRSLLDGCDVVVHLAAQTGVPDSMEDPMHSLRLNGEGTLGILQECVVAGVGSFILASTGGAILGDAPTPVHEGIVPKPVSPYGASKLTAEAFTHVYAQSFGLSTVSLRFSNVYGPRSDHKNNAVPNFIKALRRNASITIFGDGENTRDFLFVEDLVEVILSACEKRLAGEAIHLGTGREISINELVKTLQKVSGVAAKVRHEPARVGDVRRNYADISYARARLGFDPVTTLEEGLRQTWDWFAAGGV